MHWGISRAVTENAGYYNHVTLRLSTLKVRSVKGVEFTFFFSFKEPKILPGSELSSPRVRLLLGHAYGSKLFYPGLLSSLRLFKFYFFRSL